jgi:hypothetical protein
MLANYGCPEKPLVKPAGVDALHPKLKLFSVESAAFLGRAQ